MSGQVVRAGENLTANPTSVGLDTRMETHVAGQHVRAGETPAANVTQIGLGARVGRAGLVAGGHVLGQPVMQAEHLAANGAHVGHLLSA